MSKLLDRFRYFKQKGETLPTATAESTTTTVTGKTATVNAGSSTKLSAPRTV